jgi:hypothetical protein
MGRVPRNARCPAAARVLPLALMTSTLLVACGAPPEPALTAPPGVPGFPSLSGSAYPISPTGLPTGPVATYPTAGLPAYPTPTYPAYPTATSTTTPPATATTTPPPSAPKCTSGPTAAQMIAAVKQRPGIPADAELKVIDGPYCAGTWQFTVVEVAAADAEDQVEPLSVVSNGAPAAVKVIEAGADVCSLKVRSEAPPGIRVRACGS